MQTLRNAAAWYWRRCPAWLVEIAVYAAITALFCYLCYSGWVRGEW